MSSMELIFLISVFFVKGLWETEALSVTGELRGKVTITCSHVNAFSNIKYFCKEACTYEDVLITSREKQNSNGKYLIKDEGNTFYVTITDLTKHDSGTYWCGIERVGVDTYNYVLLTVIEGNENTNTFSSKKLVYVGAGLGVAVFSVVMLVLLIRLRHRRRHIRTSFGKDHDAKQSSQKHDAHHITTTSSNFQHQDTSSDHTDNVSSNNATVSSEVQDLLYTTVSFNKHKECSTVAPLPASVIYATVTHTSTDE